jgi:Flp pilus assembly protein TadG
MRVRGFSAARLHDEEQGAVLAIVAITLLVLLGMLVLTFDLGRGVAIKRNAVNAADSGALAAAMECGLGNGDLSARQAADELVVQNNADADVTGFELDPAECNGFGSDGENTVTVTVGVPQDYAFAQIFGFEDGTVVASATAEWTMGVANPVPLKLNLLDVQGCNDGHPPGFTGPECYFTFEKSGSGSQRGWLDFPQGWPTDNNDPTRCTSQAGGANELREYIDQMGLEGSIGLQATLWDPPPTYVCAAGGVPNTLVQAMQAWLITVADMDPKPQVFFPVAACDGQAAPCYPWFTAGGERGAYPVIDLVGMRIVDAWSGQAARQQENCEFERRSSDVFCIQMEVASPDDPVLNADPLVRLID